MTERPVTTLLKGLRGGGNSYMIDSTTRALRTSASPDELDRFSSQGHVRLQALLSEQAIASVSSLLTTLREQYDRDEPTATSSDKVGFLWKRSPELLAFIMASGLGSVAASLLGVRQTRLIHDVYFQKRQDMAPTPWHRDSDFWAINGGGAVTLWIPLQDTPAQMALRYIPRSHKFKNRRQLRRIEKRLIPFRYRIATNELQLGDVAAHHYGTLHSSAPYDEPRQRRSLALHFMDADSTLDAPRYDTQRSHNVECGWDALPPGAAFPDAISPLLPGIRNAPTANS
ncbi:MAG: hypothetical protein NVSMB5_18270 [Candidatus Velthaea sp.]